MIDAMPESLQIIQKAFSDYIRDPERAELPQGVEKRRMDMYRELFFNNIDSFLSGGFPVLKRILNEVQWHALARDFFARHTCSTPYFSAIAEEFLAYLRTEPPLLAAYPPFMAELAHYEWVEMALAIAQEDAPAIDEHFAENPGGHSLALSALAWPLAYRYPVQRLSPQFQPQTPPEQATYLIVFRDPACEVRFLEITPLTFALLQVIEEQPGITAREGLQFIAAAMPHGDATAIHAGGLQIIGDLAKLGILIQT